MTEDPDVALYTMVGRTAVFNRQGSTMISNPYHGLLYVRDGKLCHENTFGNRLCCKCSKKSWPLLEIKQITMMNEERLAVPGSQSGQVISLNPGVKMIFQDAVGNCETLVTALPHTSEDYADKFSTRLCQCVDTASEEHR